MVWLKLNLYTYIDWIETWKCTNLREYIALSNEQTLTENTRAATHKSSHTLRQPSSSRCTFWCSLQNVEQDFCSVPIKPRTERAIWLAWDLTYRSSCCSMESYNGLGMCDACSACSLRNILFGYGVVGLAVEYTGVISCSDIPPSIVDRCLQGIHIEGSAAQ